MDRKAAINFARVGAQKLWAGTVHIHAGAKTGAHHHGALESVIYVIKGRARMRWGEALEFTAEAGPILAHGFLRLRCGDCGHDKLVAFSCKRRGLQSLVRGTAHGPDGGAPGRPRHSARARAPVGAFSTCVFQRSRTPVSV